jgi:hypothetical protein
MPTQQFLEAALRLTKRRYERIKGWLDRHRDHVHRDVDGASAQNKLAGIVVGVESVALLAANTIARLFNFGARSILRSGLLDQLEQNYAARTPPVTPASMGMSRRVFRNAIEPT